MKALTEPKLHVGANAWGATTQQHVQEFQVEPEDVGTVREDYRGHGHSSHKFTAADVGRVISVHSWHRWTCWTFGAFWTGGTP